MEEYNEEWLELSKHITILANPNIDHTKSLRWILDDFFLNEEETISPMDNQMLDFIDRYELYLSTMMASYFNALENEYYLMLGIIDNAQITQSNIVRNYIRYTYRGEERDDLIEWLDDSDDYYRITIQQILHRRI